MEVKINRMDRMYQRYQKEFEDKALAVMRSGWYVLGNEVAKFEEEFARYVGGNHCVSLASGLDALWISFRLLDIGEGDEVIVQGNAYIASVMGITINGAKPVFCEPDDSYRIDYEKIEKLITEKTKAILVVHLYGVPAEMDKIADICNKYKLKLIEDCAQAHGAKFKDRTVGTFGDVGCYSFYPSKNLGAFGDGGAVVVNDESLAEKFRIFRNYGSEKRYYNKVIGANSRLDEIQAGMLRVKLKYLDDINKEKQVIAKRYLEGIKNDLIELPKIPNNTECIWHQFVIRCVERERLISYLNNNNVDTLIHYPIPPHLSEAYSYLGYKRGDYPVSEMIADTVLSLPSYNGITQEEQAYVIDVINAFQ